MLKPTMNRPYGWAAVLSALLLLAACTSPNRGRDEQPTTPTPTASAGVPLKTIADSEIGDRLTVTAVLVSVISARSFVVEDADLPDRGLLALGQLPDQARPPDLLTLRGVIDTFEFDRLARTYGLVQDERYDTFRGRKILIADDVRSWA